MHIGGLQHFVWLGLQWNSVSVLPPVRQLKKQLFHLPQETSRLEIDAPEYIFLLVLEVSTLSKILIAFQCYFFLILLFIFVPNILLLMLFIYFFLKQVFLLGVVFTSKLELHEEFKTQNETHQPPFLPLLLCKQYYTENQRSWWDAACTLMRKINT